MKKLIIAFVALILFSSHDMYLKLDSYFLQPDTAASIKLYNGTFSTSENTIDRNRMLDVSLVGNGERWSIDTTQWREEAGMTILDFTTAGAGTWVAGVSTRARNIEMEAASFNDYLEHDGVLDMLNSRKENGELEEDAIEKYSKHVKTIFQVGNKSTNDWQTVLGYPIEFVPLTNPYHLHAGEALNARLLWQGEPLANQLVYVGTDEETHDHDHDHSHGEEGHTHSAVAQIRTNEQGEFYAKVPHDGHWYLRTIHLVKSEEEGLTHESNWATLTFEVGHSHVDGDHSHGEGHHHGDEEHSHDAEGSHTHDDGTTHTHHEEEEGGLPAYIYWLASFAIVAGLFFWFNRQE
ncbi:MAG: DUF4198 domain-containing protein [Bacteroidota bacterium]